MLGSGYPVDFDIFGDLRQRDAIAFWRERPAHYWKVTGFEWIFQRHTTLLGPGLAWLGPAALLSGLALERREQRMAWLFVVLACALTLVVFSFAYTSVGFRSNPRYHQPFAPLLWLFALGAVSRLLRIPPLPALARLGITAVLVAGLAWKPYARPPIYPPPPSFSDACESLAEVPEGAIIATNRPETVSWHCDRHTVYTTGSVPTMRAIEERFFPIAAVFIRLGYGPPAARFIDKFPTLPFGRHFERVDTGTPGDYLWIRKHNAADPSGPARVR